MDATEQTVASKDEMIGSLDAAATIAESWKLILIATVAVAVITGVILLVLPATYRSAMVINMPTKLADLIWTPAFLDPVAADTGLLAKYGGNVDEARSVLWKDIDIIANSASGDVYRIAATADTPDLAKQILDRLLQEIVTKSKPIGTQLAAIQAQISILKSSVEQLQQLTSKLLASGSPVAVGMGAGTVTDYARSRSTIIGDMTNSQLRLSDLERLLGGVLMADVIQPPTTPSQPLPRSRIRNLAIITGATFVFMAFIALFVDRWRRSTMIPARAERIQRISRAFRLRATKAGAERPAAEG